MSNTRRATQPPEPLVPQQPTDQQFLEQAAVDQERELLAQLRNARAMLIKADYMIKVLLQQLKEAGIEPQIQLETSRSAPEG